MLINKLAPPRPPVRTGSLRRKIRGTRVGFLRLCEAEVPVANLNVNPDHLLDWTIYYLWSYQYASPRPIVGAEIIRLLLKSPLACFACATSYSLHIFRAGSLLSTACAARIDNQHQLARFPCVDTIFRTHVVHSRHVIFLSFQSTLASVLTH